MKIIVIAVLAIAGFVFLGDKGASLISDLRSQVSGISSQVTDLLPGGDAYALGVAEGEKILQNSDYLDQINISLLPGATELINSIKTGQITKARISEIANIYFPVAAVKAGILNLTSENRAEFVRGVVEGYFPK